MLLIQTQRDTLLKPLQAVTGIVERRHTLPILSNVLIEAQQDRISFMATDLEIQISTYALREGGADYAITVSAKKLQDIFRALPENTSVSLEAVESKVQIKAGKSRFNLQTLPAQDFPRISVSGASQNQIQVSQKALKNLLSLVQYAMAQQDIRYYLNGLLFIIDGSSLKVVATDGHRLGFAELPLEGKFDPQEVILPRKTILELSKLLLDTEDEVAIEFGQNQVRFAFSNIALVSKVVDGKFPDYTRVIPTGYVKNFTVPRVLFLQALQRASILSNEKFRGVRLVLTHNNLRIICTNNEQEEAHEELEIDYNGDALDIGFNITYLLDVLNNIHTESITCAFGDANTSTLISIPDNTDFQYVVMPMRI